MFSLTPSAEEYIKTICKNQNRPAVKLEVKGGGCSGFTYNYEFVDKSDAGDFEIDLTSCKFIVDQMSVFYVAGTILDYEQGIGGSTLKLTNPNQKSSCGCGKSFSI